MYGWGSTGGASQFDCTPFNSFPNILQEAEVRVWKHGRALIGQLCLTWPLICPHLLGKSVHASGDWGTD